MDTYCGYCRQPEHHGVCIHCEAVERMMDKAIASMDASVQVYTMACLNNGCYEVLVTVRAADLQDAYRRAAAVPGVIQVLRMTFVS